MTVELEAVAEHQLDALKQLCELGAYDLSELSGARIKESGLYLERLDLRAWLDNADYELFFIRADGELAGFVVIRHLPDEAVYYLNHFFILRKFRRKQVGREAAVQAFDRHRGRWRVSQFDWNVPAQLFWRNVIRRYTHEAYQETRRSDDKGPAQEFSNHLDG